MGILDEDVARVRAATDFVQVASEHIQVRRVGRRWVGLCPFHAEKTASFSINAEEGLYYCLAGETRVLTWAGARAIRELAGTTQRVLTDEGRWVVAPFLSFGVQPLMKVTLARGGHEKVLHATPEHRWLLGGGGSRRQERTTAQLRRGQTLAWSFPPNRLRQVGELSRLGVARGIAYGDGSVPLGMVHVDLEDDKEAGLPPSLDEPLDQLAGWLAGYLAADGQVADDGTTTLASSDPGDLELVRAVGTRLGVGTSGITRRDPQGRYQVELFADDLDEGLFLHRDHRARWAASAAGAPCSRAWTVRSVEPTGRREQVYCAVVEGTHSFTLEDNVLTGNCFGCQAKGDVITFVREVEHLDFVEAVERLAASAGIQLRYDDAKEGRDRQRRSRLVEAMERAVEWYHQRLLAAPDAAQARSYLRSRGYDGEVVRAFRLGWAPEGWDTLARALSLPDDVLRDTGLGFVNRRNRQQDAFRGRVMFPIFDASGAPVAFGGRALPGADGPKYKNSPETPIYSKSRTLYALNWAKADVVSAGEVIVCEGYTDVIGFFGAGLPRAVATCGTALADEHFRTLKNFARRIVLAYDADAAGQAAAERFYEWERRYELDIAVAALPPGADPADVARTDPAALKAAVEQARPFLAFRLERVLAGADLRTPESRARTAEAAVAVIGEHPNELVRDQYLMQVADRCRLDPDRLRAGVARGRGPAQPPRPRPEVALRQHDGPELEALRLAVHRPEDVAHRIDEVLFADELYLAAFRALSSAPTLHEAIEVADPGAAALLQRVAVEDTSADPDDVVALLVREAVKRVLRRLEAKARASEDEAVAVLRDVGWLQQGLQQLPDVEATNRLVAWLVQWGQEEE